MKRGMIFLFFLLFLPLFCPQRVSAIEPASMISAAPQAAKLAAMWTPSAISALTSTGQGMVKAGEAFINMFRLPLGILQCSFGAPFGYFYNGCENCLNGAVAPFKFIGQVLLLPVRFISLGSVR